MSIEIKIPVVGESITEVTISKWLKNSGDMVASDEIICELESDKATFELNAESAGKLEILKAQGETAGIGTVIGLIEAGVSIPAVKEAAKPAAPEIKSGRIIEMKVPAVGESIAEVTISSWLKKDGDTVQLDEVIAEVESEKATFELTAEASGILKVVAGKGATLGIGALICTIEEMTSAPAAAGKPGIPAVEKPETRGKEDKSYAKGHPSPSAKKILDEKGIHPSQVPGTGKEGRISKEDALKAEKAVLPAEVKKTGFAPPQEAATPAAKGTRQERREKLSTLRKTLAKRLVSAKNETAMLTTFNEVNMLPIMDLRKKYKDVFKEKHDVGLGFMSFFTKACCLALKEWPAVNASIDGEEVVYHDYCDISIAVSAPKGLVVPVIRNAESLNFPAIEKEVVKLATRARENKLTIEEMSGGTFTITNGGIFGSMLSTPIINVPQSAILGMHNIVERPVAENGQVVIRPVMYLALSYDHRIIDGRESVSFLVRIKQLLEDPARLLLEV